MARVLVLLVGASLTGLLGFLCINGGGALAIQESLQQRVIAALADPGLEGVTALVDGRDITLSGRASDEAAHQRALTLVSAVPGVRLPVRDRLAVQTARPDPIAPNPVQVCQQSLDDVLAQGQIQFAAGSSTLTRAGFESLAPLVEAVRECLPLHLEIANRSDVDPALGAARAEAILGHLVEAGVPVPNLVVVDAGVPVAGADLVGILIRVAGGGDVAAPR